MTLADQNNNNFESNSNNSNILLTGGCGFIGSCLVPALLKSGYRVTVIDNLSSGKKENLSPFLSNENFHFIELDLIESDKLVQLIRNFDVVFHLAANADVRTGEVNTEIDFVNNIVATRNLLEAMRKSERCKKIIFTSSSVIYGEPAIIPTPENYGPLNPISLYGASKLSCEALISGYVSMFGLTGVIFRLSNIIGPTNSHGVIVDFIRKLTDSQGKTLNVLGDGTQDKSYLYIDDCIEALIIGLKRSFSQLEIFNVGSDDKISVNSIAQIIMNRMGCVDSTKVNYIFTTDDGRGWKGDVKDMLLLTDSIKRTGWKIRYSSTESVIRSVNELVSISEHSA